MAMTMTQKILAGHAGLESVCAGQLIEANVDLTLANDITGPVAIREMEKARMQPPAVDIVQDAMTWKVTENLPKLCPGNHFETLPQIFIALMT